MRKKQKTTDKRLYELAGSTAATLLGYTITYALGNTLLIIWGVVIVLMMKKTMKQPRLTPPKTDGPTTYGDWQKITRTTTGESLNLHVPTGIMDQFNLELTRPEQTSPVHQSHAARDARFVRFDLREQRNLSIMGAARSAQP